MTEYFANFGFLDRIKEYNNQQIQDMMLVFFQFRISQRGYLMINPISSLFKTYF